MTKFIVVVGGVMSGVGKGVATASIGKILKEYGFSVTAVKIDPYINCDAGTMRPTEHGEVWVTDDGGEIDQDLGNYERFLGVDIPKRNNITTGQVYRTIIEKERRGDFLGETVQFIPHVPEEINRRVKEASKGYDICLVEIGGTIGDYENIPFLLAMKTLEKETKDVIFGLITYLPVPHHIDEMKTKPTQTAVRLLIQHGIVPDFIMCRGKKPLDEVRRKKIEIYSGIGADLVISAPDIDSLYYIPLNFEIEGLGLKLLHKLDLKAKKRPSWGSWKELVANIRKPIHKVKIAIVGKYIDIGSFSLRDSYISISEALEHAGANLSVKPEIDWIDAKSLEKGDCSALKAYDGILIPGGFGSSGVEGKINAIKYARENNIPFLGLCYGMQLAVVEFARNVCGLAGANTTEVDSSTKYPVIDILPEQAKVVEKGGTMRLGAYAAVLKDSQVLKLYKDRMEKDRIRLKGIKDDFRLGVFGKKDNVVLERHRHRYEVNPFYIITLEKFGLKFPGYHHRKDGTRLMEFIELENHPYFVATQGHPEFKSRLEDPAPLFLGFVKACSKV